MTALLTLFGIIISSFFGYLAVKGKNTVDGENAKIGGEKSASDLYRDYGLDMDTRFDKLQARFDALEVKFEAMKTEKEQLALDVEKKDRRIELLEQKVDELQKEVEKYKGAASPEHLAEVAHQIIDKVKDETIINSNQQ